MLFSSGNNLLSGTINFISNSQTVTVLSAYLKLDQLIKINSEKKINQIIVRWQIEDLLLGSSDLQVYYYCQENNISLFRNTRIHLKVFWDNNSRIFFGSANLTERGIGEGKEYNFELNGILESMEFRDKLYLNRIINQSEFIDIKLFEHIESIVSSTSVPKFKIPELLTEKRQIDHFLISQLPMTYSPYRLFDIYSGYFNIGDEETNCAIHDIEIFNIPLGLNRDEFLKYLTEKFNTHPFILSFKSSIVSKDSQSMRFGEVRRWFANNTTTVPVPRIWDLNEYINTLYTWICFFDINFSWSIPGRHSQVIFYNAIIGN